MPSRTSVPVGAPIWADLSSSDQQRSIEFYTELFGWDCDEPQEKFGGYANFLRDGQEIAGIMPAMEGNPADVWGSHFCVADAEKSVELLAERGGTVIAPVMDVAGLLDLAIAMDPGQAFFGLVHPKEHKGQLVTGEPGSPYWYELHTRDYRAVLDFYTELLGWTVEGLGDTDDFRYSQISVDGQPVAGVMDATSFLPDGVPAHWSIYWTVENADRAAARATELGASVVMAPETTPYGTLGTLSDPTGAVFKIAQPL